MNLNQPINSPVTVELPCGSDIRATAGYLELKRRIDPKFPGSQSQGGSFPAYKDYNQNCWDEIASKCVDYFRGVDGDTHGFRGIELGMIYSLARLRGSDGLTGWSESLRLLTAWIDNDLIWTTIQPWYPQEPRSTTARVNLIKQFCAEYATTGAYIFRRTLEKMPLSDHGATAETTIIEWRGGRSKMVEESIQKASAPFLDQFLRSLADCTTAFKSLCNSLEKRLGPDDSGNLDTVRSIRNTMVGPDDSPGKGTLGLMLQLLAGGTSASTAANLSSLGASFGTGTSPSGYSPTSQEEVRTILEAVIGFYTEKQPSSPVLLLTKRARLLVGANLPIVVKEIFGPSAAFQLETVVGTAVGKADESSNAISTGGEHACPNPSPRKPIATLSEAVEGIDSVCRFYTREEPSSPIPWLLGQARDLVGADFRRVIEGLLGAELASRITIRK